MASLTEDNLGARCRQHHVTTDKYNQPQLPNNPEDFENELKTLIVPENTRRKKEIITHLKDPNTCQLFYQHYLQENPHYAMKFLPNCSQEFIKKKFHDISKIISPKWLKILCEKCPEVVKLFFESFETDRGLLEKYLLKEQLYYDKIRFLLKVNGEIFLDITEKYIELSVFKKFSSEATRYFMKNYRERFDKKPELYTAWILDMKTVAKALNKDEIKDVVIKLARAKYLRTDFTYKFVEDFIKALPREERAMFKKQIFVDKCYGDPIENWPYSAPHRPECKKENTSIFQDEQINPRNYGCIEFKRLIKKRKMMKYAQHDMYCENLIQSPLDQLFNQYRFAGFDKVFQELNSKIRKESLEGRQNMILVLISKSGGKEEFVHELLKYLCEHHINEPDHLRATAVRSLVKRCSVWRLSSETWTLFLHFASNLGLDGSDSNVPCNEGIHACVLHLLLTSGNLEISSLLWETFLNIFTTYKEYSLTMFEKQIVIAKLPKLLLDYIKKSTQSSLLGKFFDVFDDFNVKVHKEIIETIVEIVRYDSGNEYLLKSLFRRKIARKELIKEYFCHIQTEESYKNALKHDPGLLEPGKHFEKLVESDQLNHNRFFQKLAKFYNESDGLAQKYLNILLENAEKSPRKQLARPIAILAGDRTFTLIEKFDSFPRDTNEKRFASELKANMHLAFTTKNILNMDWEKIGAKAVANQTMNCCLEDVHLHLEKLLSWKKANRIALAQSIRIGKEFKTFSIVAKKHPILALKTALWYSRRENNLDGKVWDIVIPLINSISEKNNERLINLMNDVEHIPVTKKPDYYVKVFRVVSKTSKEKSNPILCKIHNILHNVSHDFIEDIFNDFLINDLNNTNIRILADTDPENYSFRESLQNLYDLYFSIFARYLLLCNDELTQQKRLKLVDLLFESIESAWSVKENKSYIVEVLQTVLKSLKYHKVYLNTHYVSSLPVFEYIVNKMKIIMSKEKYFRVYVRVHLSMLYFKAVRQSIKNNPDIFNNLQEETENATKIVGYVFGSFIGHEIVQLLSVYSSSVVKLYHADLAQYIGSFFMFSYRNSQSIFVTAIIKGILETKQAPLLTSLLYHSENGFIEKKDRQELTNILINSKNEEAKFMLFNLSELPN